MMPPTSNPLPIPGQFPIDEQAEEPGDTTDGTVGISLNPVQFSIAELFWSVASVVFTIALQIYMSVGLVWALTGEKDGALSLLIKIGIVLGQSFCPVIFLKQSIRFLRWRIRSDAVEFFEKGVAIFDSLCPWSKVDLRRSQFHQNRVMVYYKENQTSAWFGWTSRLPTTCWHLLGISKRSTPAELLSFIVDDGSSTRRERVYFFLFTLGCVSPRKKFAQSNSTAKRSFFR